MPTRLPLDGVQFTPLKAPLFSMGPSLDTDTIQATLSELNQHITTPLWLFGGLAVDFLVGRWTRPHSDIDLNATSASRDALSHELRQLGYEVTEQGWITFWVQKSTGRSLEIVFLDRLPNGSAILHIPENAPMGTPGTYTMQAGYLDEKRYGEIGGLRFRVTSPAGEWLARTKSVIPGRKPEPKIEHDLRLLEAILPPDELAQLRLLQQ